jgi:hypothetical protein
MTTMTDHDPFIFRDPTGAPGAATPGLTGAGPVSAGFPPGPSGEPVEPLGPIAWRDGARRNVTSWRATISRVRHVEGPRGVAVRWSVGLRYLAYLGVVVGCSALVDFAFAGTRWSYGGTIMLFSAAGMLLTASLGTMFMPDRRAEVLDELRRFLFQMLLFPSTAIALAHWFLRRFTTDPGQRNDFLQLLDSYLPVFFLLPAVLSLIVFVKAISGFRVLNKSRQDSEEMMNTWTRQDWHQR